jgi:hypothetical protein
MKRKMSLLSRIRIVSQFNSPFPKNGNCRNSRNSRTTSLSVSTCTMLLIMLCTLLLVNSLDTVLAGDTLRGPLGRYKPTPRPTYRGTAVHTALPGVDDVNHNIDDIGEAPPYTDHDDVITTSPTASPTKAQYIGLPIISPNETE